MSARRSRREAEARLAFEALSIEGGLLSPEWLGKIAQLAAGGQGDRCEHSRTGAAGCGRE